jgi:hypothetical protein
MFHVESRYNDKTAFYMILVKKSVVGGENSVIYIDKLERD